MRVALVLSILWGLGTAAYAAAADAPALAAELAEAAPERLQELQERLAREVHDQIVRLAGGEWTEADVARLAITLMVDAGRFAAEPGFRSRVVPAIAAAFPNGAPVELRDQLILRLSRTADLHDLAPIEAAWGVGGRTIADRLVGASAQDGPTAPVAVGWPDLRLGPAEGPISVSIYSLAARFFAPEEATAFLRAVRRWAPERAIVVLADYEQSHALAEEATALGVHLSQTWSHAYSPWPRDPMSFLQRPDGAQVAVLRPNRQPGRESDSLMGLELIQDLPAELDGRIGPLEWIVAPIPFHNGNLLPAGDEIWLSLHSLEPRILELLRLERIPIESFAEPEGVRRYIEGARLAAQEIERLFGKRVRFVHPLPGGPTEAIEGIARRLRDAMLRLGRGAGFDLDSLVTPLPLASGGPAALVGDLSAGTRLVADSSDAALERLRTAYRLAPAPAELRIEIEASHRRSRAEGLESFLDLIAGHLADSGFAVQRSPLILVPTALLEDRADYPDESFLLGWNNVVLEVDGDSRRAEGFASLLEDGDDRARELFAQLGYELELLPPLIESVLRNGGYRCASNHIRGAASTEGQASP